MDDDGLGYADEGQEEDWDVDEAPQLHHTARSKSSKDNAKSTRVPPCTAKHDTNSAYCNCHVQPLVHSIHATI